jgi:hypothetical protein
MQVQASGLEDPAVLQMMTSPQAGEPAAAVSESSMVALIRMVAVQLRR